jgi:hypothetical protein
VPIDRLPLDLFFCSLKQVVNGKLFCPMLQVNPPISVCLLHGGKAQIKIIVEKFQ